MNINWKEKLTSRKFWAAIIAVITSIMVIANVDKLTQEQVIALISASGVLVAYIIGEGMVDYARLKSSEKATTEQEK
ncbi:MAG: hypothetical protein RR540_06885 [Oscillospiraceae bacterium]